MALPRISTSPADSTTATVGAAIQKTSRPKSRLNNATTSANVCNSRFTTPIPIGQEKALTHWERNQDPFHRILRGRRPRPAHQPAQGDLIGQGDHRCCCTGGNPEVEVRKSHDGSVTQDKLAKCSVGVGVGGGGEPDGRTPRHSGIAWLADRAGSRVGGLVVRSRPRRRRPAGVACYRRRAGSRWAWWRASASADTRAYFASDRTEV